MNAQLIEVTILGCGSSLGIPVVGCGCQVCSSSDQRNRRSRSSALIKHGSDVILIDASPDLRTQMMNNNIEWVSHVLFSHAHADHCHGIDDLRSSRFARNEHIPVYGEENTISQIQHKFGYMFREMIYGYPLIAHTIEYHQQFTVGSIPVTAYPQNHGKVDSTGFMLWNSIAYSTDVKMLPDKSLSLLKHSNPDIIILGCLGWEEHGGHAHVHQCLAWIEEINPKLAVLTHLGHTIDYQDIQSKLPSNVVAAFDGMCITYDPSSKEIEMEHL